MTNTDPAALFREMLGEWEKMANTVGGGFARSDEFARAMHGATAAQLNSQEAVGAMMTRALAAANMPSRAEIEDLSARLARIEAQLARIEERLGGSPPRADRPKPKRTRKPPSEKTG
ncbi:MAG: hypothetical protein J0I47_00090 [Sphingomonas sp.]|uniref:poly(R)-hydroxyalkanoic acid synthase subunit PhaE n=1 Tax=Sphingomonas sp. TaxID=28214 RepID=UPI001AC7D344|nr:poly(R)-hydroxyalkanoic acid synthase subunit PhaE [Sphingomonas sp.]MBN8806627.1 hypothetical protein [Sphingomonas sp.]